MACDFHTHNRFPAIQALISSPVPLSGKLVSKELHPWDLPEKFAPEILPGPEDLVNFAALGEIGLDQLRGPAAEVQERYFHHLLDLAEETKKPVVIHAVRTIPEVLAKLRKHRIKAMIHGFRSSPEMLDELWERGVVVSFHPAAIRRPELMKKLRHAGGGFGFESDDRKEISVPELLAQAAAASGVENMEAVTDQNFADFLEL